jgi:DNA polymerase-3 subunit delta'
MAEPERNEDEVPAPLPGPLLERARAAWLAPVCERLQQMRAQGRLPHGLLLVGPPGGGQREIGVWLAAMLACRAGSSRCGHCADCRLFDAGNHPDFHWLRVAPDRKEISIGQVRELLSELALKSYRGGAKIALIEPAESMNSHSFNALLKTLEEPARDTYLVLATSRADRIPRTIASRCMRLRVPLPARPDALAWLDVLAPGQPSQRLLDLANGAPFLAAEFAEAGLAELDGQMREALARGAESGAWIVDRAHDWAEDAPGARLQWLESWLASELRAAALSGDLVNNNRLPWLRGPGRDRKIRSGYLLLDELREARRLAGSSLNMQLLFEGLLVSVAAFLAGAGRAVPE